MESRLENIRRELELLLSEGPQAGYLQVLELLDELAQGDRPPLAHIQASEVRLVVTDRHSGRTFQRQLPLDYEETANGVTISGETYAGQPVQIAFLSEFAVEKLRDLQGSGANRPRCQHQNIVENDK